MNQLIFLVSLLVSFQINARVVKYCTEVEPIALNPAITSDGNSSVFGSQIFNRLVELDAAGKKLEPLLAESWTISKDQKTYTFKLRKNVSFHETKYFKPTRLFNADDVLFTYNRYLNKKHPYHNLEGVTYPIIESLELNKVIKEIKKLDSHTVQFVLSKPFSPFLSTILELSQMGIHSKEYADKLAKKGKQKEIDLKPIGTGPFKYHSRKPEAFIKLETFEKYFAMPMAKGQLFFIPVNDPTVRLQKIKTGECDVIASPNFTALGGIEKDKKLEIVKVHGENIGYIGFNTKKAPFDNSEVRKAFGLAMDRDKYLKLSFGSYGVKADMPISPFSWASPKSKTQKFDPARAKTLLKKASFDFNQTVELWSIPVSRPYFPYGKKVAELVQADLKKIGVKVKLVSYDWQTYLAKSRAGDHQMIMLGWMSSSADPAFMIKNNLSCNAPNNRANWCNQDFEKHIDASFLEVAQDKRQKHFDKAFQLFQKDQPWIPISHGTYIRIKRKDFKNYSLGFYGADFFEYSFKK